jgi:pimeloyl-ACP methyl ester carboxylesterase
VAILPHLVSAVEDRVPWLLRWWGWRSRWVTTTHGRLHVFEVAGSGSGPPIVLVHGLGSRASDYALLVRRLRPHTRRIVVPDLPGHGWSEGDAPDAAHLDAVLAGAGDVLLPEPSYLLGNSMGGLVAVRLALAFPERVRALLLVSPAGAPMDEATIGGLRQLFGLATHREALAFVERLVGPTRWVRHVLALTVRARLARPAVRAILAHIRSEDMLRPEEVRGLSMPVWLCWGGRDGILGEEQRDFYRACLPTGSEVEMPEQDSHSPFMIAPGPFARRMRRFLSALEGGSPVVP